MVLVAENNPLGTSIMQVSSSDPDLGSNSQVSYHIVASDLKVQALSPSVLVSAHSGLLFMQRSLDQDQL